MQNVHDDKELFAQIVNGDRKSFDLLFLKYHTALIGFCKSGGCEENDAEDAVSDLFLDLWLRRSTIAIHTSLRAYLYAALRNKINNLYRNNQGISYLTTEYADQLPDADLSRPDEKLFLKDRTKMIEYIITGLPEQTKIVFLLKWKHHLSDKEIAETLNKSLPTVRTMVYRAILYIRDKITFVK
ncbi:RNA polymerase sigma-70 factor (ECF subfamily) [Pedobacter cryoconitis]|uniref:RNA polymerase sigma-70 factor (ECF subfamily) n=1 Tax=Pedobacter cryoconitis TaxID=188932 RepID=A0A7W8ZLC0_9SPHI|nr:sigma-70 family RNA polymerase sigma factor [Pedobacter cryoconitis]MBB5635923.1 RNA polymerase sigma-70 factor (ECF subfamily) [Pedobacter cryoconitis]